MSKMKELDIILQELESKALDVIDSVKEIRSFFSAEPSDNVSFKSNDADWDNYREEEQLKDAKEEAHQITLTEVEKQITIDELKPLLVEKARSGKSEEVKTLLNKYGYQKLSQVDPKDYKKIYAEAEVL